MDNVKESGSAKGFEDVEGAMELTDEMLEKVAGGGGWHEIIKMKPVVGIVFQCKKCMQFVTVDTTGSGTFGQTSMICPHCGTPLS